MKKILFSACVIILLLCLSVTVFAASDTYQVEELGLQVDIPSDYMVITRATPATDPVFNQLGISHSDAMTHFTTGNIYLNAVANVRKEEIVVTMTKLDLEDFGKAGDATLNLLAAALVKEYTNYGVEVSNYDVYHHAQTKFIRVYFYDTNAKVHGLQYYTVYDKKAMNFTMRSGEGSLLAVQEQTIQEIVDSIRFGAEPSATLPEKNTPAFTYTDNECGVAFTVPANWEQQSVAPGRQYIDVKFVSTKEAGTAMIYGSADVWEDMPASEKAGHTRADVNNDMFTKADIAEMYGTTADKISMVTYNGTEYFRGEVTQSTTAAGMDVTVTMTILYYIDNGWIYSFQFGGTQSDPLYADFEKLLNTVTYPTPTVPETDVPETTPSEPAPTETPTAAPTVAATNTPSGLTTVNPQSNAQEDSQLLWIIIGAASAMVLVVAVLLILVLSRKKKEKAALAAAATEAPAPYPGPLPTAGAQPYPNAYQPVPVPEQQMQNSLNPTPVPEQQPVQSSLNATVTCRNCGAPLPEGSRFCPNCGAFTDNR